MQKLTALLDRLADHSDARWWIGRRPPVPDDRLAAAIATTVGLPTASGDPFADDGLIVLERAQAAHVLAVAATTSLAYDAPVPVSTAVAEVRAALGDMASDAVYLGNGRWQAESAIEWTPVTSATFDCGVIGYDGQNAFIFWVEEED